MAKNKGVKRGSQAHQDNLAMRQARRRYEDTVREHLSRVHAFDLMTVALGELADDFAILRCLRSEWFWRALDNKLDSVCKKYGSMLEADEKEDKDCVYTHEMFDRELKSIVGPNMFCPWEERYDLSWYSKGLRIKQVSGDGCQVTGNGD